jgi:hypothetical protein
LQCTLFLLCRFSRFGIPQSLISILESGSDPPLDTLRGLHNLVLLPSYCLLLTPCAPLITAHRVCPADTREALSYHLLSPVGLRPVSAPVFSTETSLLGHPYSDVLAMTPQVIPTDLLRALIGPLIPLPFQACQALFSFRGKKITS